MDHAKRHQKRSRQLIFSLTGKARALRVAVATAEVYTIDGYRAGAPLELQRNEYHIYRSRYSMRWNQNAPNNTAKHTRSIRRSLHIQPNSARLSRNDSRRYALKVFQTIN